MHPLKANETVTESGLVTSTYIVPLNFLTGKPWKTTLLSSRKATDILSGAITLKESGYTVGSISAEIERSTGMTVEWIPTLSQDEVNIGTFTVSESVPEIIDRGQGIEIPTRSRFADVVGIVAAFATEVGLGDSSASRSEDREVRGRAGSASIWLVTVSSNTIIFVKMPVQDGS